MPCLWRDGQDALPGGPARGLVHGGQVIVEPGKPIALLVVLMHMVTDGGVLAPFAMVIAGGKPWPLLGAVQADLVPEGRGLTFPDGQPDHSDVAPGDDLVKTGGQRRGHGFTEAFAVDELVVRPCLVHMYVVEECPAGVEHAVNVEE